MLNPKANAPAAPNSLQRVVSFCMIYSFAFDPKAPGSKPHAKSNVAARGRRVAEFLCRGARKPRFTGTSSVSRSRNLSLCFDANLNAS
jgi:hypothetical protein